MSVVTSSTSPMRSSLASSSVIPNNLLIDAFSSSSPLATLLPHSGSYSATKRLTDTTLPRLFSSNSHQCMIRCRLIPTCACHSSCVILQKLNSTSHLLAITLEAGQIEGLPVRYRSFENKARVVAFLSTPAVVIPSVCNITAPYRLLMRSARAYIASVTCTPSAHWQFQHGSHKGTIWENRIKVELRRKIMLLIHCDTDFVWIVACL